MQALVVGADGAMGLEHVPFELREGEVSIRIVAAGICGTDLQILEGYAGFTGIPGHEFVGVVEEVSSPADAGWIGRRVVGEINVGCRQCAWCAAGVREHCRSRSVVGIRGRSGAFAERLSLPVSNLHAVPEGVEDRAAVFVEPLAAACRILEQVVVGPSTRCAVVGDGRMGLLVAQVLRTRARDITLFGKHESKMAVARALGVGTATDAVPAAGCFDLAVDVTGRPEGLGQAVALTRPRGTVVLKSTFHGEAAIATWPIVVEEVTLVGSRCGPFGRALELLASREVEVLSLVSKTAPLDQWRSAFAEARQRLKVLFLP
ncbi:MAG TPA: alcohol dehydrogenase catalytic domain-containing protein [Vicinamibacterales bacterium]|nr:alcohol dehydrogenase catalytic domain-containing protein [Vicinamibacterales bacterium]